MVASNDDDLMSQVFASVQLPEVKWSGESHETHEVIRKTITTNENGEQHVHTENYHYNSQNGGHHNDNQHHVEHSDSHGYHGKADEDLVSQVFFNRPTGETFRVENGIPESDDASERSSSRMSHHSHHSNHLRHMSESDRESHHGHILAREHEVENGHLTKKVLETVPNKTRQQDNMIAELKKQHSGLDDTSDDETLKGDDDDDHTVSDHHEEMWHHEPHQEEHIVHYEMPPHEPPRDYDSHRNSVAHSDHNAQQQQAQHANYFNSYIQSHDNRSQRSNSVHSEASRHSAHAPPSHHTSHDSIPPYKPPPPPQPATRDSRASSTSTLRSERDIRIVTNHTPPAAPKQQQAIYDHVFDVDENAHHGDPKGIHTYREYGTHGHRRSNASERSSVDYNRESFTVGDVEYIREKPKARERTATKQSTMSNNHASQHQNFNELHDNRFRADTKQSAISQQHHSSAVHYNPVKRQSYTPRGVVGSFVANVDDSPIAPVSSLASQWGGRSHGNKALFFPQKHEEVHHIADHHSRASSKRGSDASSVHSVKHIPQKTERSDTHHTVASHVSHGNFNHKRSNSTNSVATQHTAIVDKIDKHPGKYDSVRVVKNVRSYKEFLDVWSQREIEEATEEGPIPHVEPIPRPRYSISARHVYPEIKNSLKVVQEPKHRPSLRPSDKLNEITVPGKVDKATSYHNLHLIGDDDKSRRSTFIGHGEEDKSHRSTFVADLESKSRKSTFIGEQKSRRSTFVPIQEEDEISEIHHHHHHHHHHHDNGVESPQRSRKSTLERKDEHDHEHHHHHHEHDDEDYEIDLHELRSRFENESVKSRRASMQSVVSGKNVGPIAIIPASHRHPFDNGLTYSSRRRRYN